MSTLSRRETIQKLLLLGACSGNGFVGAVSQPAIQRRNAGRITIHRLTQSTETATQWEEEIDRLMRLRLRMVALDAARRKQLYDQVQETEPEFRAPICLASPRVMVAARSELGNFCSAVVDPFPLRDAEELFCKPNAGRVR